MPIILVLYGAALVLMLGYKITRESHAETRRLLAAEAEEAAHPGRAGLEPVLIGCDQDKQAPS